MWDSINGTLISSSDFGLSSPFIKLTPNTMPLGYMPTMSYGGYGVGNSGALPYDVYLQGKELSANKEKKSKIPTTIKIIGGLILAAVFGPKAYKFLKGFKKDVAGKISKFNPLKKTQAPAESVPVVPKTVSPKAEPKIEPENLIPEKTSAPVESVPALSEAAKPKTESMPDKSDKKFSTKAKVIIGSLLALGAGLIYKTFSSSEKEPKKDL